MGAWTKPGTFKSKLKRKKLDTATEPTNRESNEFLLKNKVVFSAAVGGRAHDMREIYSLLVFRFSLSKYRLVISIG